MSFILARSAPPHLGQAARIFSHALRPMPRMRHGYPSRAAPDTQPQSHHGPTCPFPSPASGLSTGPPRVEWRCT